MTDSSGSFSRRSILRSAAAGTAGLPLVGTGVAEELIPDDQPPGPEFTALGFDCDPDREEHYTEVSREPTHDFGEEETVELDSDQDGEKVQLGVLWPDLEDGETAPVILRATPYVSDLRNYSVRDCIRTRRLAENYVEQGYAVAAVAVRGTGGSGGCMELMGPNEQADVDQAVTWLGEHDNSNGNVGIIGRSYDGSTPWMPARLGNPHLATVVPFCGVADIHGLMYKRGSAEFRGYGVLPALYYIISADHGPQSGTGLATFLSRAECPDNYAQGTLWSNYSAATGDRDPSGYWTERILKRGVDRNYEGSVLMVHGLQDWNVNPSQVYPWTNALREAGIKTHIYFSQMGHHYPDDSRIQDSPSYNPDWADFLLAWFESELKGKPKGQVRQVLPDDPDGDIVDPFEARVHAQSDDGEWYTAKEWPPKKATATELFLGTDDDLRTSPDGETDTEAVHINPNGTTEPDCDSCVTFSTEPFDEAFRIAGTPHLHVTATPTGPGGHLSAFLYRIDDADDADLLGWGQVDLRFAQDRASGKTVVPGEELDVHIPFEPLDSVVPEGERLTLVIHQETHFDREYSPTPAPVEVEFGGDNSLILQAWGGDLSEAEGALTGTRDVDSSVYTAGQPSRQTVTIETPESGQAYDVVPVEWDVYVDASEAIERTEDDGDVTRVIFAEEADGRTTYQYLLEAPEGLEATNRYEFGPAEIESDDGRESVPGTEGEAFVAGIDT